MDHVTNLFLKRDGVLTAPACDTHPRSFWGSNFMVTLCLLRCFKALFPLVGVFTRNVLLLDPCLQQLPGVMDGGVKLLPNAHEQQVGHCE